MRPCKRLEIVLERSQMERLIRALHEAGADGYTFLMHAGGSGDRGYRRADDVTDTDENCVFIVAAEDDDAAQAILDRVRPILERYGGMCLLSDAQWLIHAGR
ncbi:MAG: transcriptional regulator [Pseudomonadota bacterium]